MAIISFTKIIWDYVTHKVNPTNLNRIEKGIDDCAIAINSGMVDELGVVKANISKDSEKLGSKLAEVYYNSTDKKPPAADVTESTTKRFVSDAEKVAWNAKEPAIGDKGTAFNKSFGNVVGSVCQGNDGRLTNSRKCDNTFDVAATAKTNIGLGSVLNYGMATQAEAEAGAIDTKYMSPLRTKQAINEIAVTATWDNLAPLNIKAINDYTKFDSIGLYFYPAVNGTYDLGTAVKKWDTIYAVTDIINTSDANKKTNVIDLSDKYKELILKARPVTFKLLNDDGTPKTRLHSGLIAQEIETLMTSVGLTDLELAAFIKSPRVDDEGNPVLDDQGNQIHDYGLRYGEFIAPMIAVIQDLKSENEQLKSDIQLIKQHLGI